MSYPKVSERLSGRCIHLPWEPRFGSTSDNFGLFGPTLRRFGATFGPQLANTWSISTSVGATFSSFGQLWPKHGQHRRTLAGVGKTRVGQMLPTPANFGRSWPEVGQIRPTLVSPKFGQFGWNFGRCSVPGQLFGNDSGRGRLDQLLTVTANRGFGLAEFRLEAAEFEALLEHGLL